MRLVALAAFDERVRISKEMVEMSKLGHLWDWLLLELICLSPMGAIAYYNACVEKDESRDQSGFGA